MKIMNDSKSGDVYYGLHMCPGVAEYTATNGETYRIMIGENCAKQMDSTFAGRPVYVRHVDEVIDLSNADGFVSESFFNKCDGKHWAKFIAVTDRSKEAIKDGWKLSNAYIPKQFGPGGTWHNVEYLKEVMQGEYEHLAIVPNPRYEESIVLTPEEFKAYNSEKELELQKLANSKGENEMSVLNLFKRTKVENAAELETMSVKLKSGTEKTIKQLVNEAEELEEHKKNEEKEKEAGKLPMANGEHMVKVGNDEMSVNALVEKYNALMEKHNGEASAGEIEKEADNAEPDEEALAKAKEPKKAAVDPEEKVKKKQNSAHFRDLKNAPARAEAEQAPTIMLSKDKVEIGKARYGSGR